MKPEIIISDYQGHHNNSDYANRLKEEQLYKDQSTICIVPTRGLIHFKVVQNWLGMMTPMNQKFIRIFIGGMEVGEAYSHAIDCILANDDLKNWKYVLTLEEDNMIPPDGLLKLIKNIGDYDAIGGLYWTKGEAGQPMCYGNPNEYPINFIPQIPVPDSITECNGLGMGFTLFKLDSLKKCKEKFTGKLFETVQRFDYTKGGEAFTQDLYFFNEARKLGLRFACDATCKVGHYDASQDRIW